ncbi:MAG: YecA family protein [Burkholderiales bacterium]|nr:YecA family protein [Burkholderiales bacterium]
MEGFLTALAIGPRTVTPSEWIPWIWDMDAGEAAPEFESMDEANRVLSLMMRHYNAVVRQFIADPTGFEPIYLFGDQWGAAEWCEGFLLGMKFDQEAWSLLMIAQPTWFAPFMQRRCSGRRCRPREGRRGKREG